MNVRRFNSERLDMNLSFFDKFTGFAYRIFQRYAESISRATPELKEELLKSDLHVSPQGLVSVALLVTTLSVIVATLGCILGIIAGVTPTALLILVPPLAFLLVWNAPKFSQSSRAAALDTEIPFLIGFMAAMAGGGLSPIIALRRIAELSSIFPASSKEAKRILVDIDVFGLDPLSALEKAAKYNPNRTFSDFLNGYTTTLKMGGDHVNYLNVKLSEIYEERSARIKRASDTISMLAESYIILTAVLGISLFAVYQMQTMLSNLNTGLESILLFSFLGVPLISFIYIWILDQIQFKQPFMDWRSYKLFFISSIVGGLIYFMLRYSAAHLIPHYMITAVALMVCVALPGVQAYREAKNRYALEKMLPLFLKGIAEGRKMGLSPEKCIESLADRNYGNLTKHIKKMSYQLSWGLPLRKVISTFNTEVNSWLTKVIGSIVMEVIDVGGGTLKSFVEMATFTYKVDELERSKRSSLKPYVFITYFSAILMVVSLFLTIFFIMQPLASTHIANPLTTQASLKSTTDMLLTAAVFQSWIIGLVAGKMGESSVAQGFKHSLILVVMTVTAVCLLRAFMPFPL
ncbi:MAG: type II secretion system F family protein [Nitrososphaerales archaeon]